MLSWLCLLMVIYFKLVCATAMSTFPSRVFLSCDPPQSQFKMFLRSETKHPTPARRYTSGVAPLILTPTTNNENFKPDLDLCSVNFLTLSLVKLETLMLLMMLLLRVAKLAIYKQSETVEPTGGAAAAAAHRTKHIYQLNI